MTNVTLKHSFERKETLTFYKIPSGTFFVFLNEEEELCIKIDAATILILSQEKVTDEFETDRECFLIREVNINYIVNV